MRISHPIRTKLRINKLERNYELFTPESSRAIFTDEGYTVAFDEHQKLRTNNENGGVPLVIVGNLGQTSGFLSKN